MIQRFDICTSQVSAKLLLMYSTHGSATRHYKTLHAFGNTIGEIADVDREVTAADLLATAPFKTISYNPDKILHSPGSECSPSDTMRFSLILLIH